MRAPLVLIAILAAAAPAAAAPIRVRVATGQSLASIAQRYACSVRALKRVNGLGSSTIYAGQVLEVEPNRRLVHTFTFPELSEEPTRVTYEIVPLGDVVRLTMTHEGFDGETETYRMVRGGWAPIFDGLKTLLETGAPLRLAPPSMR